MAIIEVKCRFCQETKDVKNMVLVKAVINDIVANYAAKPFSLNTLTELATLE